MMLFKKKKRSDWMEGLICAETLHKDDGYSVSMLLNFYSIDLLDCYDDFVIGFLDYISNINEHHIRNLKNDL